MPEKDYDGGSKIKLGSNARKLYYNILDQYIKDHIDQTETVPPSKLSDMTAILCPDIPVSHVKSVCTNFMYLLFYLIREKKLKIVLPEQFSGVRPKKTKPIDTTKKT